MTAPDLMRTGCRVLDKDGDGWGALDQEGGYAEWKALELARDWAARYVPDYAPFTVVDADGVPLHTINAPEAK